MKAKKRKPAKKQDLVAAIKHLAKVSKGLIYAVQELREEIRRTGNVGDGWHL